MSTPFSNLSDATRDPAGYVRAVLGLLGAREPLAVLRETPGALRATLESAAAEHLNVPEAAGKWSAAFVVHHFADSELVWGFRLRMLLTAERPRLAGYDQNVFAERLHRPDDDPWPSLALFGALRASHLALLERATPADLARVSVHEERGEESLAHTIRLYAGHDLVHRAQLERILAAVSS